LADEIKRGAGSSLKYDYRSVYRKIYQGRKAWASYEAVPKFLGQLNVDLVRLDVKQVGVESFKWAEMKAQLEDVAEWA
jgi:hypothetical protein